MNAAYILCSPPTNSIIDACGNLRSSQTGCIRTFMLHIINRRRAYDVSQSMGPCFGANQNVDDWLRGVLPSQSFDVCNILSNSAFKMMEACLAKIAYAI